MADDRSEGLPAPVVRARGYWLAVALVPLPGVVLGAGNVWLAALLTAARLPAGLSLTPLPAGEWWRLAVLLPAPALTSALLAWRYRAAGVRAGWRASIGCPVLAVAVVIAVVTAALGTRAGWLPWWAVTAALLLPCGYACAACLAALLAPGRGLPKRAARLTGPVCRVGAGQAIVIAGISIAAQPGIASTFLGAVTIAAGLRLLVPALVRGGNSFIRIVDPDYSLDLVAPLLTDAENDDDRAG
jgi:hypothetical protein